MGLFDLFGKKSRKTILTIQEAEKKLGLLFADDYKNIVKLKFPKEYCYATIMGLSDKPYLDVVTMTKIARKEYPNIPTNMYVIANLGIDFFYMLQDQTGKIYECHASTGIQKAYNNLNEYLQYLEECTPKPKKKNQP